MKMAVFWDVALCSLVDIYQVPEELTASIITLMMLHSATTQKTAIFILKGCLKALTNDL
jgi:hypothetical protein